MINQNKRNPAFSLLFLCVLMCCVSPLTGTENLDTAQKLLQQGKYKKSWDVYSRHMTNQPADSFRLNLDAAAAAAKSGAHGWSALFLERAEVIHDGVPEVAANLHTLRRVTGADRYLTGAPLLIKTIFFMYFYFDREFALNAAFILLLLLINGFTVTYISGLWRRLAVKLFLLGIGLTAVLFMTAFLVKDAELKSDKRAVVVHGDLPFFRGPESDAELLTKLPAATPVTLLSRNSEGRIRVSLPGGSSGWIDPSGIRFVNLRSPKKESL